MLKPIVTTLLAACALGGCGGDARGGGALKPPVLRPLGRVTLAESDTLYVGRILALAVDSADGSLYVTDGLGGRVFRYAPSGARIGIYGKPGEGPGELKSPGAVEASGREVVVVDGGTNRVSRFRRDTGEWIGGSAFAGSASSVRRWGGRLWLGALNVERGTSLATWAAGDAEFRALGTMPGEFGRSEPLAGIFTGVEIAAWGDTILAGYMGINRLTLFRADGTPIRSLSVPVRARKGELPNLVQALDRMEFPDQFSSSSALFRMARLPGGNFGLVYYDQEIDGSLIRAKVYLTMLSADFGRACVDGEVPVSRDAQPYTAFRGDTLYVAQQAVNGDRATTFVDRYVVDEAACPGD